MKRFLSVVLVVAMLCALMGLWVSASVPIVVIEEPILDPVDEILEEALGYIAQTKEIFDSGTFTLKMKYRQIGSFSNVMTDIYRSEIWIYDKENDKKLCEMNMKETAQTKGSFKCTSFEDRLNFYLTKVMFGTIALLFGSYVQGIEMGPQKFATFPQRFLRTGDVSGIPVLEEFGFHTNFSNKFYIHPDYVLEVKKEDDRISLLCGDELYNRYFEFTKETLTFFREVNTYSEKTVEWSDIFLSPVADESYFSTKGMIEIPLDWLTKLL